jgi:hypothetical protein
MVQKAFLIPHSKKWSTPLDRILLTKTFRLV